MQARKIPVPDDVVARRLATTTQQALADEYGVSRWAVRDAAARHRKIADAEKLVGRRRGTADGDHDVAQEKTSFRGLADVQQGTIRRAAREQTYKDWLDERDAAKTPAAQQAEIRAEIERRAALRAQGIPLDVLPFETVAVVAEPEAPTPDAITGFPCPACPEVFLSLAALNRHVEFHR